MELFGESERKVLLERIVKELGLILRRELSVRDSYQYFVPELGQDRWKRNLSYDSFSETWTYFDSQSNVMWSYNSRKGVWRWQNESLQVAIENALSNTNARARLAEMSNDPCRWARLSSFSQNP